MLELIQLLTNMYGIMVFVIYQEELELECLEERTKMRKEEENSIHLFNIFQLTHSKVSKLKEIPENDEYCLI